MAQTGKAVAIIGGGTMGEGIVPGFVAAGWQAHVVARSAGTREALPAKWAAMCATLGVPLSALERAHRHASLATLPWQDIDLVIETVSEDLELKQRLFEEMEGLARPGTIFGSNSSSFPISRIAGRMKAKTHVVGLHYFMPAHLAPLVEVVSCASTLPEVAERAFAMMTEAGKKPVRVKRDVPGFLANRLQHALLRECFHVIDAGIASPEDVDVAVRYSFGFRFMAAGPILQRDFAGLDVNVSASATIYPDLCNDAGPAPCLMDLVKRGRLGVKAGAGFFDWTEESIAREKARYAETLRQALKLLEADEEARR